MSRKHSTRLVLATVVLIAALLLTGCGATATPAPTVAPTAAPTKAPVQATVAPTSVPPTAAPTKVPATATVAPKQPTVGGKLEFALFQEPDTLDPHKTSLAVSMLVMDYVGATLVARAPDGQIVPYLASSWKVSADGLTWDFSLKKGVKFHDGSPMTAKDWVYTFNRIADPNTKAAVVSSRVNTVAKTEAVDDYTFRVTLKTPFAPLLTNLAGSVCQVLSQASVDKAGAQFGRQPVGAGPYVVKQFNVGDRIVLERNADYNWGPAYAHAGAAYIQTIEFRTLPEVATATAGLEAGEIDAYWNALAAKDVDRLKATGKLTIYEGVDQTMYPALFLNTSRAPFNDVKVRQAFNLALDRSAMIKVMVNGAGVPQYGPLSPSVPGYWTDADKYGASLYSFNLDKAKALMKDAGYTTGASGMLEKDGQPFKLTLMINSTLAKQGEFIQGQYKALGVDVVIEQSGLEVRMPKMQKGDYDFTITGYSATEADGVYTFLHSSQVGGNNFGQIKDPDIDKLLDAERQLIDPAKRQTALNDLQKLVIDKAYFVALYAPTRFMPVNNRVKGALWSAGNIYLYLNDAYIE